MMVRSPAELGRARLAAADAAVLDDLRPPGEFPFERPEPPAVPPVPARSETASGTSPGGNDEKPLGVRLRAREQKGVMLRVDPPVHDELRAMAAERGQGIGRVAAELLVAELARRR